jgi:hypothetical protein
MLYLRKQISDPRDRDETASSRGGAGNGEAWMRICRRLRAELGFGFRGFA